jgi:hypothetical protein
MQQLTVQSLTAAQRRASALRSTVALKVAMAISGLIMVLFLLVHMYGNLKVFSGAAAFDDYAHLGDLPQGQAERRTRALAMIDQHDAEGFGGCTQSANVLRCAPKAFNWTSSRATTATSSPPASTARTDLRPDPCFSHGSRG